MIALTACEQSTEDWPTADEMLNNLQKAGYVITEGDKVQVGAVKHKGYDYSRKGSWNLLQ